MVKKEEGLSCSMCQKPFATSKTVKTLALCKRVAMSLIVGRGSAPGG